MNLGEHEREEHNTEIVPKRRRIKKIEPIEAPIPVELPAQPAILPGVGNG